MKTCPFGIVGKTFKRFHCLILAVQFLLNHTIVGICSALVLGIISVFKRKKEEGKICHIRCK